jgi:uncharacterized membrane protein
MSEKITDFKTEQEKLVNEFLSDVEKKLPFWLRAKEETVEEILEELESHIWDRATELAKGAEPSSRDILTSIAQMGTPNKIAKEYKRRGKPKFFITEELWDSYTRALIIIGSIVLVVNLIIMFVGIGQKNVGVLFGDFFNGLFISVAVYFILLTVQFVYLSKEGYLPEDFRRFTESRIPGVHEKIFR